MELPLVTILLATYNRTHLIGETLDSILAQTYANWECIIIDDNSTDNTEEYLKNNYLNKDYRFSYYKKDLKKYKKGLASTRNIGLNIAIKKKSEFIQFFDDDDIMHPEKLKLQMVPFFEDKSLDMTLCMYRSFKNTNIINYDLVSSNDGGTNVMCNNLFWDFYAGKINLNSLGPLWKLKSLNGFRFDETLSTGEERDFYLRVFLKKNIKYKPIEYVLFWYRKHNVTVTNGVLINKKQTKSSLRRIHRKIKILILFSTKTSIKKKISALLGLLKFNIS
ncbi:glycosyltransferase family 2 protein [Wenyingzhuangia sp. IMCC45467]